jgi:hypothetical protein
MRRNSWTLPALLVLVLIALIVGIFLESKVRALTPSKTPAISTRKGATPTATGGVSKPLPGQTAVPTIVGLRLGMITHKAAEVRSVQSSVDAHKPAFSWYLNPVTVVRKSLPRYGFVKPVQLIQPAAPQPTPTAYVDPTGRPTVKVLIRYRRKLFTAFVSQPGRKGPRGIWLLLTIIQGRQ